MISLSHFESQREQIVGLLQDLVSLESPTSEKAAVDRVGARVADQAMQTGARVRIDPQPIAGNHIIAQWGEGDRSDEIVLLCHMDTVHPIGSLAQNPCQIRDGNLTGPGCCDMKAGIAILFAAIAGLQAQGQMPARPLTALFTTDEEVGSLTSRSLIEQHVRGAALTLCLEPALSDGSLKTWRKGVGDYFVKVTGRAAHAGAEHEQGRNAIEELAHQVLAIQKMTDYDKGTTLSVGVIRGGTASNVVPAEAEAEVDFRVLSPAEADRVSRQMKALTPALADTRLEISGGLNRPPMPRDSLMVETFEKARSIAAGLGLAITEGGTGGGSDANFVAPLGTPVLDGLGGIGGGQHSEREFVKIDSLVERTALLAALLAHW